MSQTGAGVSVVVPVFGGGVTLEALVDRIEGTLDSMEEPYEIILVDDASNPPTRTVVLSLAENRESVVLLRLHRNAGQHAAVLAGIREASYPIIVTLDDDLQNPPEEIPRLVNRLRVGDLDVIHGYARRSSHTYWRRRASRGLRGLIATTTGDEAVRFGGSFRAFWTDLRNGFATAVGPSVSLNVLLSWSTQRFGFVEVRHDARADGESGYTPRKLLRLAFDMLTGHSTILLSAVSVLGILSVIFGLGVLAYVIVRYVSDGSSVAGFPFLASTIALFSGAQMLSLGILGHYLGRIHVRVQGRPSYYIAERISRSRKQASEEPDS